MDKEQPYFSVILPVFNRRNKISEAIQSVLNQSYTNWELLVIDDCSTDDTANIILAYTDSRINYLKNLKNQGPAGSRNNGIKNAKGKIISFLDSDDQYFPDFLEKTFQVLKLVNPNVGFIWTGLEVIYSSGKKIELWVPEITVSPYYTFLKELRIGTNSGLSIRKEVFDECGGFNESLTAAEDTELLLRIVRKYQFTQVKEPLINIDKSGRDRLSLDYKKNAFSYNKFIAQHWPFISKFPELKKKFSYKLMWLNYHLSEIKTARHYFKEFRDDFGFDFKVVLVYLIFEVFGTKLGARIHILLSK